MIVRLSTFMCKHLAALLVHAFLLLAVFVQAIFGIGVWLFTVSLEVSIRDFGSPPKYRRVRATIRVTSYLSSCLVVACLFVAVMASPTAQASFGIESLTVTARNSDGTIDSQAGSQPYEWKFGFGMNLQSDEEETPEGTVRDIIVDIPAGMVGNPRALPRCARADFVGSTPDCSGNTQIGIVHAQLVGLPEATLPVYNLAPSPGVAASIGFAIFGIESFQEAGLRTGPDLLSSGDYGVRASDITLPAIAIQSVTETLWGVPADPRHDAERQCIEPLTGALFFGCASEVKPAPFFTLPTSCTGPLETTLKVDSVEEPGVFQTKSVQSLGEGGTPEGLSGCERLPFSPSVSFQPETNSAESPSGLHVNLHFPQNEDPEGLATAHLRNAVVTLPRGLVVNPSIADGLAACPMEGPEGINLPGSSEPAASEPAKCPAASKIATVQVETPLLDHPVPGSVYIARQKENPFGSLMALYIAVNDPISGVVAKLAGKVEPDQATGQLKATFLNNPQLPFEDFKLDFSGGPRAALTTPSTCGTYTTTAALTPWSAPEGIGAAPSDIFRITGGANGGRCVGSEAELPNKPSFEAGTVTPIAGSYSPFVLKMSRENGSQRIGGIDATLPKGLAAKFAGIPYCSEAQIAAAKAREALGQGAVEKSSPSCPLASEVGVVNVGAGSGAPFYVQGRAYLAGRYKGAPLSFVIITPAVAGPFDLGVVVVRTALYVNSETAQGRAVSDPLPQIIQGIPVDLRSIAVDFSRPDFTLNPTSCERKSITGAAILATGQSAALSSPFQVGACAALGFKPTLALNLKGGTKRTKHPALRAVLTYPKGGGYANTAYAQVTLPHSEFLDTTHIRTICTRVQFAAETCPKGSIYGFARAFTPLLDKPLEGPVYLRSSNHKLPDLVLALRGQVDFNLVGRVDTGKNKGLRSTFETAPDAPVSKVVLEMKGGKKGLFVNSENLCAKEQRAIADFRAHNGKVLNTNPLVANSCGKRTGK
jgi:hypothetical protein